MSLLGFHTRWYVCCIFNIIFLCLQMSCVPALCAPTERPASTEWRSCRLSDGSCSAERRSKPTRTKYTNVTAVFFFLALTLPLYLCDITQLCSLKAKHAFSDGLRLRLLLIHQRENWKNMFHHFPPPLLLPLWSHKMVTFNSSLMTFLILKKWPFISAYKYAMISVDNEI